MTRVIRTLQALCILAGQSAGLLLNRPVPSITRDGHPLLATMAPDAPTDTVKEDRINTKRRPEQASKGFGADRWEIWLFNDEENYEYYVAEQLVRVGDLSELKAYRCMKHADQSGKAVLGEYSFESAEHYTEALRSKGLAVEMIPLEGEFQ